MSTFDDMRELRDDLEMAEAGGLPAWLTTRTKLGRELQALARKHYARWVTAELQLVTLRADAEKAREATDAERATNERLTADVERLRASLEEREADMHARIRAGYDRTVADSWRVKVAQVEAERDVLRALPVIDRCALCSWAHCDTPADGVCTHPDTLPRCAPIDPTKPPIDVCPLRGAR